MTWDLGGSPSPGPEVAAAVQPTLGLGLSCWLGVWERETEERFQQENHRAW